MAELFRGRRIIDDPREPTPMSETGTNSTDQPSPGDDRPAAAADTLAPPGLERAAAAAEARTAARPDPPVTGKQLMTLAIDVGGTGLKASVLDETGAMVADRVRVPTTYPLPPDQLVRILTDLVGHLPAFDQVSVGFPGMVRGGRSPCIVRLD